MKMKLFVNFVLLAFLASCAPKIKNFDAYQKQFMTKSQYLPDKESLEGKPAKIVVFPLNENDNQVATQAGVGAAIANDIENIVSQNKLGALVDRSVAKKLQQEIKLSEMSKTGSYKGPQVADYAISGSISNAGFEKRYSEGSTYVNPKTGATSVTPPKFTYSSQVAGNLKIYELPSMSVVENIEFSGGAVREEDVAQDGGLSFGALKIGGTQAKGIDRDDALVRNAAKNAAKRMAVDLKNALAHKGYVLEKRTLENKTIFKISIGSNQAIKNGDKFEVIGQYESENPITGENEVERKIIASGTVGDIIDPKSAWVILDDEKMASKIRLGDTVKMKYKRGFFAIFM